MRVYVEDAIIVEVKEQEPHFNVETVRPEVIESSQNQKKKRGKGLIETIFDAFLDPFGLSNSGMGFLFDDFEDEYETESEPVKPTEPKKPKPELALITESNEKRIKEYRYFYYEVTS